MANKALLITSYGTSIPSMCEVTFDVMEARIAAQYPGRTLYTAWTSERVAQAVFEKNGIHHCSIDEALAEITADGIDDLVVVPICLMHGMEMAKIEDKLAAWLHPGIHVQLGSPLLTSESCRRAVADMLVEEFRDVPKSDMVVFMAHGSPERGNEVFAQVNDEFKKSGFEHFTVATMCSSPSIEDVAGIAAERKPELIHLMPFMIAAGTHAAVDMCGKHESSWASQLGQHGFKTETIRHGLGEYESIRTLFVQNACNTKPFVH